MKNIIMFGFSILVASSLFAADATPKDEIIGATKSLADKANYSWISTAVVPEDSPFKPGPTEGKTEKDGFTQVTMRFGDNKMEAVVKGNKGAALQEGEWKSMEELEKAEGMARFSAVMLRGLKTPAKEVSDLVSYAQELKKTTDPKEGNIYAGDLTEDGAKKMQKFGPPDGEGPSITEAKGSVKFWIKEGALVKYEFKLKGKIEFNGNSFPNERTTTVEIKDIGKTKMDVPEAAQKKITAGA